MGAEIQCTARVAGKDVKGKALLETEELIFRGDDVRLKLKLAELKKVTVDGEFLVLSHGAQGKDESRLSLGAAIAEKWAEKIRTPRSLLDKLGVKDGMRVAVRGVDDASFLAELRARDLDLTEGRPQRDSHLVFFGVSSVRDLSSLDTLVPSLRPDGAIWVIRMKGKDAPVSEMASMAAGRTAGLVDVKVAKFSETHTAEKYVVPVAKRAKK
ncbi:MAG: DUF3052 domain-containing protein [Polyangiales bacterium]